MKIGLIQTQGIGDIIIALPIAKYFADRGHEVFWPVHPYLANFFQSAAPYTTFLNVPADKTLSFIDYSYHIPLKLLKEAGCTTFHVLNMNLPGAETLNDRLAGSLKFDEYKYAVAGVPFSEKWNLSLTRDKGRELALYKQLGLGDAPYICVHEVGSNFTGRAILPPSWTETHRIVTIEPLTDSPLDWLYTLEHAAKRVMVDSLFSNMVEQLDMRGENYLVQRSVTALTPVYKNGWRFLWSGDTLEDTHSSL